MDQEVILLGFLCDGPKHGYELKKILDERLGPFSGTDSTSIYYPLKSLEKRALLTKTIDREGKRPERHVYTITEDGREEFVRLLKKNFLVIKRPSLNLDLCLYFIKYLDPDTAVQHLKDRLKGLEKIKKWAEDYEGSLKTKSELKHLYLIARHNLEIARVEIEFIEELIDLTPTRAFTKGSRKGQMD